MKQCWKRALSELHVLGILPNLPTTCGICEFALHYDQDVIVKKIFFESEQAVGISLVHLNCAAMNTQKLEWEH